MDSRISFDGSRELLWEKRRLAYSVMDKAVRQTPVTDGKTVNARVEKAMSKRNTAHKPAADHPWRKMPVGKSAHDGHRATP